MRQSPPWRRAIYWWLRYPGYYIITIIIISKITTILPETNAYQPILSGRRTFRIRPDPNVGILLLRRQNQCFYAKSNKEKNEEDNDPQNLFTSFGDFFSSKETSSPPPLDNKDEESRSWFNFPSISPKESLPKKDKSDVDSKRSRTQAVRDALKRITFQATTNTTTDGTTRKTAKNRTTKDQRSEKKQQQRKDVKVEKRIQKQDNKKLSQQKRDDSESDDTNRFSVLKRITDLLPFGNTTTSTEETAKEESKKALPNPLSMVKDFAGAIWKNEPKEEWVPVFPKTRIMPGEIKPVTIAGLDLLVIASNDGRSLYCIENSCPHMGTPLETGRLTRLPIEYKDDIKSNTANSPEVGLILTETDVSNILQQDGCEDCIVCPLHRTAFALKSGEVRGEWCPYPPVLGKVMGQVKPPTSAAVFDVRIRGKNVEVRLNSILQKDDEIDRPKTER